jgi:hypothetical protein
VSRSDPVLLDTNVIIEAVRTGTWAALTGGLIVETVGVCRDEALAGSPSAIPGYVSVTESDLRRLSAVHDTDSTKRAELALAYGDADGLDDGERDLLAHALAQRATPWSLCSPDKAAIRAAVALDFGDRLVSLEQLIADVGTKPKRSLRLQFTTDWLVRFRTRVKLDEL